MTRHGGSSLHFTISKQINPEHSKYLDCSSVPIISSVCKAEIPFCYIPSFFTACTSTHIVMWRSCCATQGDIIAAARLDYLIGRLRMQLQRIPPAPSFASYLYSQPTLSTSH